MNFFNNESLPSCSECDYANEYIPYYTFPFSEPYCSKGHGKCEVDKLCGDFKPCGITCIRCDFIRLKSKIEGYVCIKHDMNVSFDKHSCDEFKLRVGEVKDYG